MRAQHDPEMGASGRRKDGGFTLLESLIALSVAAILAVGLVRFSAGTQVVSAHADRRLAAALLEATIASSLPAPNNLTAFSRSGSRNGLDWTLSAVPLRDSGENGTAGNGGSPGEATADATPSLWQPYEITLTISVGGNVVDRVETVRLGKTGRDGDT